MSLRRDVVLITFYSIGLVVGVREFVLYRGEAEGGWGDGCRASAAGCFSVESRTASLSDADFWRRHADLTERLAQLNPDDPDTDFLRAMQALADGNEEEFERRVEAAIASGQKHNGILLEYYAQYLLDQGAEWWRVNAALNRWRDNHPFSAERISLGLGSGPADDADAGALSQELARIPWVGGAELSPPSEEVEQWRLWLSFRPGREVDIRDAVAAVTLLSIPPEQRGILTVTCRTMRDCRAERRPGR